MILNVVVCYDNEQEVLEYARQLDLQSACGKCSLVIVVNKTSLSINAFFDLFSIIQTPKYIYYPNKNLGYLNGMVYGYQEFAKQQQKRVQWVIFCNTDIEYQSNRFLDNLISKYYDPEIWLIGPSIIQHDTGTYANPMKKERYTYIELKIREVCFRSKFLSGLLNEYYYRRRKKQKVLKEKSQRVYAVHGSYIILRPDLVSSLIKNGEWQLLYAEENYLAELVRENGKAVYYESDIEVKHKCGTVTGKVVNDKKRLLQAAGIRRILDNYY